MTKENKNKVLEEFGSRVKAVRKKLAKKQSELAEMLQISRTNISDIETGRHSPGFKFFLKFSSLFNVNLHYLLFGKGEMFIENESDSVGNTNILDNLDNFDDITPDIKRFLEYFFKSNTVKYQALLDFTRQLSSDNASIEAELKKSGKIIETDGEG